MQNPSFQNESRTALLPGAGGWGAERPPFPRPSCTEKTLGLRGTWLDSAALELTVTEGPEAGRETLVLSRVLRNQTVPVSRGMEDAQSVARL